jgi:hypothetical protein
MGTMNANAERRRHEIEKQILDLLEEYEEAVVDRATPPPVRQDRPPPARAPGCAAVRH